MWTALLLTVIFCLAQGELSTIDSNSADIIDEKRAQSCTYFGPTTTPANQFPRACSSDPDGAQCLQLGTNTGQAGTCGCALDADCYVNTAFPFCFKADSLCRPCFESTGTDSNTPDITDHYFCRERYPSAYVAASNIGPTINQNGEEVAPRSFYREVCFTLDGSCARCDQAAKGQLTTISFPFTANSFGGNQASVDSANGVVFCNSIRGAGSQRPGRPICASNQYWIDVGLNELISRSFLMTTMEIGNAGDNGPCTTGNDGNFHGCVPPPAGTTPTVNQPALQPIENWEGACVPCALQNNQTGTPTLTPYHGLCSRAFATTPICELTSGNCKRCATNSECKQSSGATCATDGTGSCTGGNNCQADGSCKTCQSNQDCGSLDGGEKTVQPNCDLTPNSPTFGQCIDPIPCNANFGGVGTQPCPTAALPNCNKDGTCIFCGSNAQCGVTDGGEVSDQTVCGSNGVCFRCQVNADCGPGLNCQSNGACADCTTSPNTLCTASADGGLPLNGQPGGCASTGGFCADRNGQTVCNPSTRRCEDPCLGNSWCSGRTALGLAGGGGNCQLNGLCVDCGALDQNTVACQSDGPNTALQGFTGQPGQILCGAGGVCVTPFNCARNSDCAPNNNQVGFNCQVDGTCLSCAVTYTSTTCSTTDGGEVGNQINCNLASRQCVNRCNTNAQCQGTQGANCMSNGLCLDCRSDADCATGNAWGGDGGEIGQQGKCGPGGICVTPFFCAANSDCSPANSQTQNNCQADGTCLNCQVTYTTSTCSSLDGPRSPRTSADVAGQPNCNQQTLQCVGACSTNAQCVGTQGANCMANGLCLTCRNNADCQTGNAWNGDGGEIGQQTVCGANGICINACTDNFGGNIGNTPCPASAPNCQADGTCLRCTLDSGCAATDGPPNTQRKNIVCGSNGICIDPYSCGTIAATSFDNAGCQANFRDNVHNNCNIDGSCRTCTTNALCYAFDGGSTPNQPRCDQLTGTCGPCRSNSDCPAVAANCGWDGFCYDCRTLPPGNACAAQVDGPPQTPLPNLNCDPLSGICVDFCTEDADCRDNCKPHCQVERGCCVECLNDTHCPVPQWRGTEARVNTYCDTEFAYHCTTPKSVLGRQCDLDANCTQPGLRACSFSENKCVQCIYDSHCVNNQNGPACSTNEQVCVQCTNNAHCAGVSVEGFSTFCDLHAKTCVSLNVTESSSSSLTASLFLVIAVFFSQLF